MTNSFPRTGSDVTGKLGGRLVNAGRKIRVLHLVGPALERGLKDGSADAGEQPRP
jgi:hypothetical protein